MLSEVKLENRDLKTGDIILCHGYNPKGLDPGIDGVIEFFTHSPWEHAGIIIKDPWWTPLKGTFIYQSGPGINSYPDVLNGRMGKGVTINHFEQFLQNRQHIYVLPIENLNEQDEKFKENFLKAFNVSHAKPYDANCWNWTCAGFDSFLCCKCCKCAVKRHTNNFWCSALVAYMYVETGLFNEKLDWSILTPNDLITTKLNSPYTFGKLWCYKK